MRLHYRRVVSLVTEEFLKDYRERLSKTHDGNYRWGGYISEPWWREIKFTIKEDKIIVDFDSIHEEFVDSGSANAWYNCSKVVFTWNDLDDREFIEGLVKYETYAVALEFLAMIDNLKEMRVQLSTAFKTMT